MVTRRVFLKQAARCAPAAAGAGILLPALSRRATRGADSPKEAERPAPTTRAERLEAILHTAPRARYWLSTESSGKNCTQCHQSVPEAPGKDFTHPSHVVKCLLCSQGCVIREGERGGCRARMNVHGELRSLVYGRPLSVHIDPIEKKPFYHFLPGSQAFSLCTSGCPLHCKFCQNWELSQARPEDYPTRFTRPAEVVTSAVGHKSPVIAFTYNEPTVFTEYLADIAALAARSEIRCVLISCGFMREDPLKEMCGLLKAIKIDLKGFSEKFYKEISSAALKPVLRSIKQVHKSGVHLEIVNLVIPTLNDSSRMLEGLADWVIGELGPDVPVHFTRFHPDYKLLNLPPTPVSTLEKARETAMGKGMHYAYVGNVPGHPGNHTYCPSCKKIIVKRWGFFVAEMHINDGKCAYCGEKIAGVWK